MKIKTTGVLLYLCLASLALDSLASALPPGVMPVNGAPAPALQLADLRASPLADLLTPFVFEIGERVAVVTYLRNSR